MTKVSELFDFAEQPTLGTEYRPPTVSGRRSVARVDETDAAGRPNWFVDGDGSTFPGTRYGIALSGGGIRSASFAAGVLQRLAATSTEHEWALEDADYLATVSGGGYLGISTQMLHKVSGSVNQFNAYAAGSPEFLRLRERHRYIGHGPLLFKSACLLAAKTLLNLVVIACLLCFSGYWLGRLADIVQFTLVSFWWAPLIATAALGTLLRQYFLADQQAPTRPSRRRARLGYYGRIVGGTLTLGSVAVLVAVLPGGWGRTGVLVLLALVGSLLVVTAKIDRLPGKVRFATRFATESLWITAAWALGALGSASFLVSGPLVDFVVAGLSIVLVSFLVGMDQSWISPHRFYKKRLASTFAVKRSGRGLVRIPYRTHTFLDDWARPYRTDCSDPDRHGPQLLVCATANVEDLSVPPSGLRAVPFVFSHRYVGSPELGRWTTHDFQGCLGRRLGSDGTLLAAMAISGAAIASGMGREARIPSVGRMATLFNARLGVWLPNPRSTASWPTENTRRGRWIRRRRGNWLVREVVGVLPSRKRYVYVSDGGHLDNLGLLELVRRRCEVILVVDGSGDALIFTRTFDGVLDLAREHFGITVDSRERDIRTRSRTGLFDLRRDRVTKDCVEEVHITYPAVGAVPAARGRIVLAKATFADTLAQCPEARSAAQRVSTDFRSRRWPGSARSVPRTTTVNQILSDTVFDAYVELGRSVGERALARLGRRGGNVRDLDERRDQAG